MLCSKIILIIIFVIVILIIIYYAGLSSKSPSVTQKIGTTVESTDTQTLLPLIKKKISYIEKNSGLLQPYNKNVINYVKQNLDVSGQTIPQLVLKSLVLPNTDLGNVSIQPLPGDPLATTLFQFGQGNTGWYFHYGTFIKPSLANFFFHIARFEAVPAQVLVDNKIDIGTT